MTTLIRRLLISWTLWRADRFLARHDPQRHELIRKRRKLVRQHRATRGVDAELRAMTAAGLRRGAVR